MATFKKCDYCGATGSDVVEVQVSVSAAGVVRPGTVTGTTAGADACTKCQPKAYKDLAGKATKQQERDLPEHMRMADEADAQSALAGEIAQLPHGSTERAELQSKYDKNEKSIVSRRANYARKIGAMPSETSE
jgi:hypothetical protein